MTLYGIKNCSSVRKARAFMNTHGIVYDFVDFNETPIEEARIRSWAKRAGIERLFNSRGKKYRDLKLKELHLDDEEKIIWMAKEPYLIKRPVIEHEGDIVVGYDEALYREKFL